MGNSIARIGFIILGFLLANQSSNAQKTKAVDTLLLKAYYKAFSRSVERNLDLVEDTTKNSFLLISIRMENYALKSISADFTDSGVFRLFKEAKLEKLDSFYARICKVNGMRNCTLVQPLFLENDLMNNPVDIRQLPGFYDSFSIHREPQLLLQTIKLVYWGKVH